MSADRTHPFIPRRYDRRSSNVRDLLPVLEWRGPRPGKPLLDQQEVEGEALATLGWSTHPAHAGLREKALAYTAGGDAKRHGDPHPAQVIEKPSVAEALLPVTWLRQEDPVFGRKYHQYRWRWRLRQVPAHCQIRDEETSSTGDRGSRGGCGQALAGGAGIATKNGHRSRDEGKRRRASKMPGDGPCAAEKASSRGGVAFPIRAKAAIAASRAERIEPRVSRSPCARWKPHKSRIADLNAGSMEPPAHPNRGRRSRVRLLTPLTASSAT
ncbi:hypothetical protein AB6G66_27025 [Klebsiella pneumoniae]|uniref:hypothetical protein n=1 Tax=Klebsiella pneumoniae TaxID=573 RepID=UPI0034DCEBD1